MDSTERAHLENLLQLNRTHLRELERQAATLGIAAPSHIALQIADYQTKIADLERRLIEALPRHNLPPRDYERFVGRQKELEEVRRLLLPYPKSRHHLVTIDGIGGIGKSALALETAYLAGERYTALPEPERFEAIVWVSAKRTYLTADGILEQRQSFRTLDDLYAAIAQVLDYPAITRAPAIEQRAVVEQVLSEQRTLLILDNLETVDDEELLVFLRLLPDPTKAIVTTRHRIDVAYPVRLLGMPHDDALALIGQESARKDVALTGDEPEQLFARTGGVPLAIVWSIGLMGLGGSVESVLRRLSQGQSDIARFCFAESAAQIHGRDAHKLLLALSLFATDASRETLGVVAGLGEDEFGRDMGLEELLRLSLVNKESERFSLLPLTKSFVLDEASAYQQWMLQARERWENYFYELAKNFARSQDWRGQDLVERELTNISAVINSMAASLKYQQSMEGEQVIDPSSMPRARILIDFIAQVTHICRVRGHWSECENLCYKGISIARAINDSDGVGWRCLDLSRISYYRGDLPTVKRWALEAYVEWQRTKHDHRLCQANRMIGLVALQNGNFEEASYLLSSALDDSERWSRGQSGTAFVSSMGELAEHQGDLATAAHWYQQAIDVYRQRNDLPNLSAELLNLGRITATVGDTAEAETYYIESLKLARECGRADIIAEAMCSIAAIVSRSNKQSAEAHARQALDLFRRLGMKREQIETEALLERLEVEP